MALGGQCQLSLFTNGPGPVAGQPVCQLKLLLTNQCSCLICSVGQQLVGTVSDGRARGSWDVKDVPVQGSDTRQGRYGVMLLNSRLVQTRAYRGT